MSEINVTPFVDVMLVLLIIFMVAAPMLTVGVNIDLPNTAAKPLKLEKEEPLILTIKKDGEIYLQKSLIPKEQLISRVEGILAERSSKLIFVRSDQAPSYGEVMQILGALNAAGTVELGLVTNNGGPTLNDVSEE